MPSEQRILNLFGIDMASNARKGAKVTTFSSSSFLEL